jgi:hypothetical protein
MRKSDTKRNNTQRLAGRLHETLLSGAEMQQLTKRCSAAIVQLAVPAHLSLSLQKDVPHAGPLLLHMDCHRAVLPYIGHSGHDGKHMVPLHRMDADRLGEWTVPDLALRCILLSGFRKPA